MRIRLVAAVVATTAAMGSVLGVAPAAQAAYGVDMNLACQYTMGRLGARANLDYPSQGGYGWRCYVPGNSQLGRPGVNIEGWCQATYGLHARGGSTAYNWRCDY